MNKLALFDFDGTLTTHDSLKEFLKLVSGSSFSFIWFYYIKSIFLLLRMRLHMIDAQTVKEQRIKYILGSKPLDELVIFAKLFAQNRLREIIRPNGEERLIWHVNQGHHVIVVSASIDLCLLEWCSDVGIDLITNELRKVGNTITGEFIGRDCNGPEKVTRIKRKIDLKDYSYIYAYGDTVGDLDMLELANEKFFKPFLD